MSRRDASQLAQLVDAAVALHRSGVPLLDAVRYYCDSAAVVGVTADEVWDRALDVLALRFSRDGLDLLMVVWDWESAAVERRH
jgi:hypothetical protein